MKQEVRRQKEEYPLKDSTNTAIDTVNKLRKNKSFSQPPIPTSFVKESIDEIVNTNGLVSLTFIEKKNRYPIGTLKSFIEQLQILSDCPDYIKKISFIDNFAYSTNKITDFQAITIYTDKLKYDLDILLAGVIRDESSRKTIINEVIKTGSIDLQSPNLKLTNESVQLITRAINGLFEFYFSLKDNFILFDPPPKSSSYTQNTNAFKEEAVPGFSPHYNQNTQTTNAFKDEEGSKTLSLIEENKNNLDKIIDKVKTKRYSQLVITFDTEFSSEEKTALVDYLFTKLRQTGFFGSGDYDGEKISCNLNLKSADTLVVTLKKQSSENSKPSPTPSKSPQYTKKTNETEKSQYTEEETKPKQKREEPSKPSSTQSKTEKPPQYTEETNKIIKQLNNLPPGGILIIDPNELNEPGISELNEFLDSNKELFQVSSDDPLFIKITRK
ncbi:MAG: hypothetical protein ACK4J0_03800 [Candidatus Anstonellaceae archaeon]